MERRGRRGSDQELRLPGVGKGGRATNLGIGRRGASPEVVFQVLLACELSTANPTGAWDPSPAAAFGRDMRFANLGWHTTGLMRRRVNWVTTQAGRSPGSALLPALVRRPTTPPLPLLEPAVASQQGPRAATACVPCRAAMHGGQAIDRPDGRPHGIAACVSRLLWCVREWQWDTQMPGIGMSRQVRRKCQGGRNTQGK
jgi:hypothetical protein